jgi:hypothetical protein
VFVCCLCVTHCVCVYVCVCEVGVKLCYGADLVEGVAPCSSLILCRVIVMGVYMDTSRRKRCGVGRWRKLLANSVGVRALLLVLFMNFMVSSVAKTESIPHFANYGVLLDANAVGTELTIFRWDPRVFESPYPAVSVPTTEYVIDHAAPFVGDLCDSANTDTLGCVTGALSPLLQAAKDALFNIGCSEFSTVPVYFKGTDLFRRFHQNESSSILQAVRSVLSDDTINPFYFQSSMARIISGEEQAVFTWACVNLLRDSLIPSFLLQNATNSSYVSSAFQRYPTGKITSKLDDDYVGIVDLDAVSTQIAFVVPRQVSDATFACFVSYTDIDVFH